MRKGYISTYVKTFIILVIIVLIFLGASYFIRNGYDKEQFETVKTNMFNGIQHPSIYLQESDGNIKLLREFNYLDYKNRMS